MKSKQFLALILCFLWICSCEEESNPSGNDQWKNAANSLESNFGDGHSFNGSNLNFNGSWTTGWQLGHDGDPYISNRFKVYSGYSSKNSRKKAAEFAEIALDDIFNMMNLSDRGDFVGFNWDSGYSARRIHMMMDMEQQNSSGLAYRYGLIMRALDSPRYPLFYTEESWRRVLQHEIYHVVEFLLIRDGTYRQANSVWMREGMANFGSRFHRIQELEELELWQAEMSNIPGKGNVTLIQIWSDFPQEIINANRTIEYYGFFELTVRYLLDPVGKGKSIQSMKNHYRDLGNGVPFATSFKTNFNITLSDLQANWYSIMKEYLKNPDRMRAYPK